MRIYMAGLYTSSGKAVIGETTINQVITQNLVYPWMLESFHYIGEKPIVPKLLRERGESIFMDSGAFSMFTQGINIPLEVYADFIKANSDVIHVSSNLDKIGSGQEEGTWANQKALEALGVDVKPVHHVRDSDEWLLRYLAEGYDYIFLGGMVPESIPTLRRWLDHVWGRYLTDKDGFPKVKVHGFGLTTPELMLRYPWFSVDSTAWVLASRFGLITLDLPKDTGGFRDLKLAISSDSPANYKLNGHYDSLDPLTRRRVDQRIDELGFDPELLRTHYGWRDTFNVRYFERMMSRATDRFRHAQETLSF